MEGEVSDAHKFSPARRSRRDLSGIRNHLAVLPTSIKEHSWQVFPFEMASLPNYGLLLS